jgi:hypothetical protein
VSKIISEVVVRLAQIDQSENPLDPRHLGVRSGSSITISEPMVHLVQIMHLSCTNTNIVSKQTETRFHMTYITYKSHWVHPK